MKLSIPVLCILLTATFFSFSQSTTSSPSKAQQEIINLSKKKWQWMGDNNVDKLATLFHDKSKFVYVSGTWKKDKELEIIKEGSSWYKNVNIHDVAAEIIDETAIVWNHVTLTAPAGVKDPVTEFTVTEVYEKQKGEWKLLTLTFSSVNDTHTIKH
jgi:hypothetical protein